jgi:hypothetical protein
MRRRALASWTAVGSLGLAPAPEAFAQAPLPEGSEFQVNTYTTSSQGYPDVAARADGDFVVVWQSTGSTGTDGSDSSIQGQRYASDGSVQGAQFQVNTYTTSTQSFPRVEARADGGFVVVWRSQGSSGTDTNSSSIQSQRYASDGSLQGAQFQVNTYTTSDQAYPEVAAGADGDFVVVWQSLGSSGTDTSNRSIQGQRYASDGSLQGAQFQVNTYTTSYQSYPEVVAGADGDFVVVWSSYGSSGTDSSSWSVQGQRYASDGSLQGAQFQVNTYTTSPQVAGSVAAGADGDFFVVWHSGGSSGTDPFGSIQGQHYASDGSLHGSQFQVNTYTTLLQTGARVAAEADGDFVVVWWSYGSSGTDSSYWSIQGQRYRSDTSAQGPQFQVNTYTTNYQYSPAVAVNSDDFVVVWTSQGSSGTDTSETSIHGQRYSVPAAEPAGVPALSLALRPALGAALLLLGFAVSRRRRA